MYKVRHLARAHGKSLRVLMRMLLALLSNHAISRQCDYFVREVFSDKLLELFDVCIKKR